MLRLSHCQWEERPRQPDQRLYAFIACSLQGGKDRHNLRHTSVHHQSHHLGPNSWPTQRAQHRWRFQGIGGTATPCATSQRSVEEGPHRRTLPIPCRKSPEALEACEASLASFELLPSGTTRATEEGFFWPRSHGHPHLTHLTPPSPGRRRAQ